MRLKPIYKWLSVLAMAFGVVLMVNTQIPIAGFAIGNDTISTNSTLLWGAFFLVTGVALFYTQSKDSNK